MTNICFYFQVHQPQRLRRIQAFDPIDSTDLWDDKTNRAILRRATEKCYLPTNKIILDHIERTGGAVRVAYSLSGVFLEQIQQHEPRLLESFQALADTGAVEFLAETYHHSLAGLWEDPSEFNEQIEKHHALIERLFDQSPSTFRNTELIYDDRIARRIDALGYDAILTEGTDRVLGHRSPNHVYAPSHPNATTNVLLKHYPLSDDIAFRFSAHEWEQTPLTADKYAAWLSKTPGETINLFMDYETFGEHQWPETGIFDFLEHLPEKILQRSDLSFALPREVIQDHPPRGTIEAPHAISWADQERDVSAWLHNKMQHECFQAIKDLEAPVKEQHDATLTEAWRRLQTSDHLYYCSTKHLDDQAIHAYFSPYESPYLAYINYRNAIHKLEERTRRVLVH